MRSFSIGYVSAMTNREPLLRRARIQHLPLLSTLVEAFYVLDPHSYEPARERSTHAKGSRLMIPFGCHVRSKKLATDLA